MSLPHDSTKKTLPTDEARQGETTGTVRYVLIASLGLAVLAGLILYFAFF